MCKPDLFDAAEMMTAQECCFEDCSELSAPNDRFCGDCFEGVEMKDRGFCESCETTWIDGSHHCNCWEDQQAEKAEQEETARQTREYLKRWSR